MTTVTVVSWLVLAVVAVLMAAADKRWQRRRALRQQEINREKQELAAKIQAKYPSVPLTVSCDVTCIVNDVPVKAANLKQHPNQTIADMISESLGECD